MNTALIVGGDEITGIRRELKNRGIDHITHWSGRKVGDGNKVIPNDTQLIVLVTNWISHSFTRKIKLNASRRGVTVVYTPNGPAALRARLDRIALGSDEGSTQESDCRVYGQILTRLFGISTPIISGVNHGNSIH